MVKAAISIEELREGRAAISALALAIIVLFFIAGTAFAAEKTDDLKKPSAARHGSTSRGSSVDIVSAPAGRATPIETEALDAAGEKIEKGLDSLGKRAASVLGPWIDAELWHGIRRFDLLAFFASMVVFFMIERLVAAWLHSISRRVPEERKDLLWKKILPAAIRPQISLLILLYGAYLSLFPVYARFSGDERTLVHGVASSVANAGGIFAAIWLIYGIVRAADNLMEDRLSGSPRMVEIILWRCRGPIELLIGLMLIRSIMPILEGVPNLYHVLTNLLSLVFIGSAAWLVIEVVYVASDYLVDYRLRGRSPVYIRKLQTQMQFLRRLILLLIVLVAVAASMMVFDKVRQLGASILASAGIAGVIIGFSAQRTLANLLVGLQIAITQPIRIGDIVTVEKETGTVDEINSTFAIIQTWDQKSLVVPLTYFTEKQFQNLTLSSSELLGTVVIFVDYSVPVEDIRSELHRILQGSPRWDGRSWALSVANLKENSVELTAMMSASDPGNLGNLRGEVREKLLLYLQKNFRAGLPKLRAELEIEGIGREGDGGLFRLQNASEEGLEHHS